MAQIISFEFYFSYGQFTIYDADCGSNIAFLTKTALAEQGFARGHMSVCFSACTSFGTAPVRVFDECFPEPSKYDRVIVVPAYFSSGLINIRGVEDDSAVASFRIPPGDYSVTSGQAITAPSDGYSEPQIMIDLFFVKLEVPLTNSTIIVADSFMKVPQILIEDDVTTWQN